MKLCSIEGCENKHYGKGWCNKHWQRYRTHGEPNAVSNNRDLTTHERFKLYAERSENGYWTWIGGTRADYGLFWLDGKQIGAHVYAYQYYVGPIPEGYEVDHCCRIHNCVDIRCLDAVIHDENMRRTRLTPEEHWALRPQRSISPEGLQFHSATM